MSWSDEAPLTVFGWNNRQCVRRHPHKWLQPDFFRKKKRHGGGKILVWGCFSGRGTGPRKLFDGTMDKQVYKYLLTNHARPTLKKHKPGYFQHDNNHKHSAKTAREHINGKIWPSHDLSWSSQSGDLNRIENL